MKYFHKYISVTNLRGSLQENPLLSDQSDSMREFIGLHGEASLASIKR